MTTKKLYIGNLPFNAEEGQLKIHFEADGRQVTSVKIMMDRENRPLLPRLRLRRDGNLRKTRKRRSRLCTIEDFMGQVALTSSTRRANSRLAQVVLADLAPISAAPVAVALVGPGLTGPVAPAASAARGGRDRAPGGFGGGGGGGYVPPAGAPGFDPCRKGWAC